MLSSYVADPGPLSALELATFGTDAAPPGPCASPASEAEHAALALAGQRAFPLGQVDPAWCESPVVDRPRWLQPVEPWSARILDAVRRNDAEWDEAPALYVPGHGGCCIRGCAPTKVLKKVRDRYRVVMR